jgi:hypothetical protein
MSSLTLREVHRLRMFENRVLRKTFGPKRDEVTGECRHYVARSFMTFVLAQYYSGDKIKKNERDKLVTRIVEKREVYRVLVGKTEGQNHL